MKLSKAVLIFATIQVFSLFPFLLMAQAPKEIRLIQDLAIGGSSSEVILGFWPAKITATDDGTIFIADPQTYSVKAFSKEGAFLRETGRQGSGPGDFDYLRSIEICYQNQICVLDAHARISVFDSETFSLAKTISIPSPGSDHLWTPMGMRAVSDGFIVWYNRGLIANRINTSGFLRIALIDERGKFINEDLKTVRNNEMFVMESPVLWRTGLPFGRTSHIVTGNPSTLFYGWSENIAIERLNLDDLVVDSIIYISRPVRVTKEEKKMALNSFPPDSPQGRAFRKDAHIPEIYPAYDWFIADEQNKVWIAVNTEDRENYTLCIFDEEGKLSGRTSLPKSVELQTIRNGYAYGVQKNEEGEQIAVRFRVTDF